MNTLTPESPGPEAFASTHSSDPAPSGTVAIARRPFLDARGDICGYELLDQGGAPPGPLRDAALIAHALTLAANSAVAERRLLLLPCHPDTLSTGHLDLLDPEQLLVEVLLPPGLDPAAMAEGAEALAQLRRRGFRLVMAHDALSSHWSGWLDFATHLRIDLNRLPSAALPPVVQVARSRSGLQLMACGIATHAQQRKAADLGVHWFQGSWYSQPVQTSAPKVRPNQAIVLQLVAMLQQDADIARIEEVLKRDPALSFHLLRYVNSPVLGLATEINSFRHAAMILGLKKLMRWACLLMAHSVRDSAPALGQAAVVRGRLMELLAAELLPQEHCDQAFLAGVFSLLDVMTGVPLPQALQGLPLPRPVLEALLERQGMLAPLLELTEACESADEAVFARAATALALSNHQVNMAHLQALAWAEELQA